MRPVWIAVPALRSGHAITLTPRRWHRHRRISLQRQSHEGQVEPAAELGADLAGGADGLEAEGGVQRYRRDELLATMQAMILWIMQVPLQY
jgi:hypothetical protein